MKDPKKNDIFSMMLSMIILLCQCGEVISFQKNQRRPAEVAPAPSRGPFSDPQLVVADKLSLPPIDVFYFDSYFLKKIEFLSPWTARANVRFDFISPQKT
jgi:hypothetical protein